MDNPVSVFWFRRDLRLQDNKGLFEALQGPYPVLPIFIFDPEILDGLPADDARVTIIYGQLQEIRKQLQHRCGSSVALLHGEIIPVFGQLAKDFEIRAVYTNHDYEPYARQRDTYVGQWLDKMGIPFHTFKDQVLFEKDEVVKEDGDPYVVYSPYMRKWKQALKESGGPKTYPSQDHLKNLIPHSRLPNPSLADLGFLPSSLKLPEYDLEPQMIRDYQQNRNFPSRKGTSRLGPYLRFGILSVREIVREAMSVRNETFLNELIWREFFMQILWHYPNTVHEAFKKKYDRIEWRNDQEEFDRWKQGKTGYALVDAGMRQLNATGYMHNRVRMLVASFLCKHLLIDWRWGEAYFGEKLLDYELSSNVGNWQWAAGSGVDAAPYFRIFNPMTQVVKFDKDREFIREWVPELDTDNYPAPMVDHKAARERCLEVYKAAVG